MDNKWVVFTMLCTDETKREQILVPNPLNRKTKNETSTITKSKINRNLYDYYI